MITATKTTTKIAESLLTGFDNAGRTLCAVTPKQWERVMAELDDLHDGFTAKDSDGRELSLFGLEG